MRVAIVYHFFANYRASINERLIESSDDYLFVADRVNRLMPGVEVWLPQDKDAFFNARCWPIVGAVMWQSNLMGLALRKDLDAIIYLGCFLYPATWISAILARLTGKTVLFWTHGWSRRDRQPVRFLRNLFYRIAHGMLLYGNRGRRYGIAQGFSPERLYVVFNSLNHAEQVKIRERVTPAVIADTRRELFDDTESPVIIFCGRLSARRKLHLLIEACSQLKSAGQPINLIFIGDGSERSTLEELAKKREIKAVFTGACFDDDVIGRLTGASDLTVSPGPTGLTVVQSLAFGVPVITSDQFTSQGPEVEAIIPGYTGAFFEDGNLDSLKQAIQALTQLSPEERERNRQACYDVIDTFYCPDFQSQVFAEALRRNDAREYVVSGAIGAEAESPSLAID